MSLSPFAADPLEPAPGPSLREDRRVRVAVVEDDDGVADALARIKT